MKGRVAAWLLPDAQRRNLDQLTSDLDLRSGDAVSKRSAFWTMLTLSSVIAGAGVLADSTATVIGAMIIAPLSTPIMGVALGLAKGDPRTTRGSLLYAAGGAAWVILIGLGFSLFLPGAFSLLNNSQISGRTSPGLLDLIAAIATGFAGAIAFARRDVGAVLPGVAIAISLVPPLAVVGVCLGQAAYALALGALILFVSNLLALVLSGTLIFAAIGYGREARAGGGRRGAYLTIGSLMALVFIPLSVNTLIAVAVSVWTDRAHTTAEDWLSDVPGASVEDVTVDFPNVVVKIVAPGSIPPAASLLADLEGQIPDGVTVVLESTVGNKVAVGVVGSD